jgi:hypothetical protein
MGNGDSLWLDAFARKYRLFKVVEDEWCWHPACDGYQFALLQIIFHVKFDGQHKAQLFAGGHVIWCDVNT